MSDEIVQVLHTLFQTSCHKLFESLHCETTILSGPSDDLVDAPIACIEAGNQDIEFVMGLQLSFSVLALTYPVPTITDVPEEHLEDWVSELSNQLIGHMKNQLLKHECEINLGLPASYFGNDIYDLLPQNKTIMSCYFDIDGEPCACHISIEVFNKDMLFSLEAVEDTDMMSEGEIELF